MKYEIIPIKVQYNNFKNYTYLIIDIRSKQALSVDPAWDQKKIEKILNRYQIELIGILLTHHHYDHVNLAEIIAQKYQIPIMMSSVEINTYQFKAFNLFPVINSNTFQLKKFLVKPHLTPGHTAGCICYEVGNGLFTGDTLFSEGCGMCLGRGSDPFKLFKSIQYLKEKISDDILICPGHSYGTPVAQPFSIIKNENIYLNIENSADFIKFRMRQGQKNLFNFQ